MRTMQAISRLTFYFRRHHRLLYWQIAACAVLASAIFSSAFAANTVVRMEVSYGGNTGNIDIELYDDQAPITVTNFLHYAGGGYYASYTSNGYTYNGFIHRHATVNSSGVSVIQGGGWAYFGTANGLPMVSQIPRAAPIQNEFSPLRSNVRGTIAMAKVSGYPDSATSEWFINLADNNVNNPTLNLDAANGGFTVFGYVKSGMNVVDDIANLSVKSLDMALSPVPGNTYNFSELPVSNTYVQAAGLQTTDLVMVTKIPNVASMSSPSGAWAIFTTDVDMTFSNKRSATTLGINTFLATFTPPPNKTVQFNNGIFGFTLSGTMGPTRIVTLIDGSPTAPNHYYAYGRTPDNTTPHWYDFSYDGTTGAEFVGGKILLHFVDGQRGDDDLDPTNGSVTHTGATAMVTDITSTNNNSTSSGGCTITDKPSQASGSGDWIIVSLFLAFLALARKRTRHERITRA